MNRLRIRPAALASVSRDTGFAKAAAGAGAPLESDHAQTFGGHARQDIPRRWQPGAVYLGTAHDRNRTVAQAVVD